MQPVFSEKFQLHESLEEEGFAAPLLQRDKAGPFPVEVGDSSSADGDVLVPSHSTEFHNTQVVWVLSFLQVAELVAQSSFFLHELDEVFGRELLL